MQTFRCDLHTHSRFFHTPPEAYGYYDYLGVRLSALATRIRDLDGFAVTNHDFYRPETRISLGTPIPGIEVSTTMGHVLVVGPDPPERTTPGELTPGETVELAHERGCVAILAHPFRGSDVRNSDAVFDAVEINGKRPENRERVIELARDRNLPVVGGSDAHVPFEVGRALTRIEAPSLSPIHVVEAIRAGRVEPAVHQNPVDEILGYGYRRVHKRKHGE